jgi:hypothetical protein
MPATIDLTGVSTKGRPPLDEGDYPAVITKAEIHESKASGEDTLYLDLSVGDEGRNMRWSTSLQPQSLWRFKRMLVAIGLEVPDGEFEFDEADLVGVEGEVHVEQEVHYRDRQKPKKEQRMSNRVAYFVGGDDEEDANWG